MRYSPGTQKHFFCMTISFLLFLSIFAANPIHAWGAHRYKDLVRLSYSENDRQTPNWYQERPDNYHPVGCGPVAWATLYAYWYKFKGKNRIFNTPDIYTRSPSDPVVAAAVNELGHQTETDLGQFNESTYGRTWPKNFCKGIKYAKNRGYRHSRCQRIQGTEFNKFSHIKRYLQADKPVVLLIKHDGRGAILDHLVVVEGARIRQEKVNGKWRDRDVEYLVNFGWQSKTKSEWISVRQRGRNQGKIYSAGSAFLVDVSRTPLPEAADANEAACKDWCLGEGGQSKNCRMCSHLVGCGPGYESVKSFKGAAKNWHACVKKSTRRSDASEKNRRDCELWCRDHRGDKGCVKCDTRVDCGPDYKGIKTWKGYGNNWHACRKRGPSRRDQASDENHRACQQWCDGNKPQCVKCSKKMDCGVGFKDLKSWKGYGNNWHACGKNTYGRESEKNKADCGDWCNNNKPPCEKCSTNKGCGKGLTAMKSWTGRGKNWHACRKASSASNHEACDLWCNENKPDCAKCSTHVGCGRGYKKIKSFKGRGDNWFACRKR